MRRAWPGGSPTRNALDVHLLRLRRRISTLGLEVRTVRARGYLLQALEPNGVAWALRPSPDAQTLIVTSAAMRVGVDTGGTFTDVVTDEGEVRKVPSTPADPVARRSSTPGHRHRRSTDRPAVLAHGTTVATNALLERHLGRVALVTTRGFADVIEIARQARPSLYDAYVDRPAPLVPREARFEVSGRLDAHGHELEPFDGVVADVGRVDAVAVCLLHADLDPSHERAVAAVLRARGHDVVCSHEVSPEFREYERVVTTVADAALRSVCAPYLDRLAPLADDVLGDDVGRRAGAGRRGRARSRACCSPARRRGAARPRWRGACGPTDAVAFDMGGTSTDVCTSCGTSNT